MIINENTVYEEHAILTDTITVLKWLSIIKSSVSIFCLKGLKNILKDNYNNYKTFFVSVKMARSSYIAENRNQANGTHIDIFAQK